MKMYFRGRLFGFYNNTIDKDVGFIVYIIFRKKYLKYLIVFFLKNLIIGIGNKFLRCKLNFRLFLR